MRTPKQFLLAGLALSASYLPLHSLAQTIRCAGVEVKADSKYRVTLEISVFELDHLPPAYAALHEGVGPRFRFKEWIGAKTTIRVGELRLQKIVDSHPLGEPRSHKFMVTQMPDSENALIGFVLDGTYVHVLHADLSKQAKSFTFYDSERNSIARGKC